MSTDYRLPTTDYRLPTTFWSETDQHFTGGAVAIIAAEHTQVIAAGEFLIPPIWMLLNLAPARLGKITHRSIMWTLLPQVAHSSFGSLGFNRLDGGFE
jgi:hypothetical protein